MSKTPQSQVIATNIQPCMANNLYIEVFSEDWPFSSIIGNKPTKFIDIKHVASNALDGHTAVGSFIDHSTKGMSIVLCKLSFRQVFVFVVFNVFFLPKHLPFKLKSYNTQTGNSLLTQTRAAILKDSIHTNMA